MIILKESLDNIKNEVLENLNSIKTLRELADLRTKYLGKKGNVTLLLKNMSNISVEDRPKVGQIVNEARAFLEDIFDSTQKSIYNKIIDENLLMEKIDVTIPGVKKTLGSIHPITKVIDEISQIFMKLGYEIVEGPEIEEEYYNFEALNIPKNHPARDEQDTFYTENGFLLRTQTSPVQVRIMEKGKLPIKIIAPGRVFRADEVDATHTPVFHQLEGLFIDENVSLSDLKGTLQIFVNEFFGENIKTRFRPHHFPFTEPSAEMDISCFSCNGKGCRICKNSGWIELMGCGMVHPKVLQMSNIDENIYTGFAFGMGIDRIAMQKYAITDLRLMYENDINFLKQF